MLLMVRLLDDERKGMLSAAMFACLLHGEFHWPAFVIVAAMCLAMVAFFNSLAARLLRHSQRNRRRWRSRH